MGAGYCVMDAVFRVPRLFTEINRMTRSSYSRRGSALLIPLQVLQVESHEYKLLEQTSATAEGRIHPPASGVAWIRVTQTGLRRSLRSFRESYIRGHGWGCQDSRTWFSRVIDSEGDLEGIWKASSLCERRGPACKDWNSHCRRFLSRSLASLEACQARKQSTRGSGKEAAGAW